MWKIRLKATIIHPYHNTTTKRRYLLDRHFCLQIFMTEIIKDYRSINPVLSLFMIYHRVWHVEQLTLPEQLSSPPVFCWHSCCLIFSFLCNVWRSLFVHCVVSFFTASDYPSGIFKLFLLSTCYSEWLLFNAKKSTFAATCISWQEQVTLWWDKDVCFVLDQCT